MKTIKDSSSNEIVINKSIFITYLFPVTDLDMVNSYLSQIRKKHYDATHNCYAYILGDNQEIQKASDDGEPQKTAGAPMIDVLKKQEMTNILAITTRYFGGVLLGAGGLVRAYSSSVSEALAKAVIYEFKDNLEIRVTLDYSNFNNLKDLTVYIADTTYLDNVSVLFQIPPQMKEEFISKINNITSGKASITILGISKSLVKVKNDD